MCIFHKWDKWEQYDVESPYRRLAEKWALSASTKHMQKRQCNKCGKVEKELINETVHN